MEKDRIEGWAGSEVMQADCDGVVLIPVLRRQGQVDPWGSRVS